MEYENKDKGYYLQLEGGGVQDTNLLLILIRCLIGLCIRLRTTTTNEYESDRRMRYVVSHNILRKNIHF